MVTAYFDDPAATEASFRDGWFYTGDRGAVTTDRVLRVNGRVGSFINSGGVKVDPRVIEDVLLSLEGVTEAAAFGAPDRDGLPQIWAAIVADRTIPRPELDQLCAAQLGARAPKFVVQLQELPRNENGKVLLAPLQDFAARHGQQPH